MVVVNGLKWWLGGAGSGGGGRVLDGWCLEEERLRNKK
jgi:hypothetical protein